MNTENFNLLGEKIVMEIYGYSSHFIDSTVVKPYTVTISLKTSGPEFTTPPTAENLYCYSSDSNWEIEVPDVKYQSQLNTRV